MKSEQNKIVVPLLVFLSSLGLLFLGMNRNFGVLDEGVIVYGAEQVLEGNVPYKDFWGIYTPAQFWVVAGLFKIFGPSLLVERAWDILIRASIALLSYFIVARWGTKRLALISWPIILGWLWAVGTYGYPLFPALFFTMLSACFFIEAVLNPRIAWMSFLAGVFVGVTAAFRHDIGFYAFLAESISLIVLHVVARRRKVSGQRTIQIYLKRHLLLLCLGIGMVGIPVALYLVSQVPLRDLWNQLIVFPATVYPAMRSLPYPSILDSLFAIQELFDGSPLRTAVLDILYFIPFYFHFVVIAAALFFLIAKGSLNGNMKESRDGQRMVILFLVILIAVLFLKSLVRPHPVHLIHVVTISLVLGAIVLTVFTANLRKQLALLVGLGLIAMAIYPALRATFKLGEEFSMISGPSSGSTREHAEQRWTVAREGDAAIRARYFRIAEDQAKAIEFIERHVSRSDKIFVGNGRHDIAHLSDVMFYFLSGRHSGTKFHEMHPGLTTTSEVQRQIIDELIANKVVYVILYAGADNIREPNKSAESTHVTLLDRFLSEEYQEEVRFGMYSVRRRKTFDS